MTAERLGEAEEVTLDGRLDEPFWSRLEPATDFIMQDPILGGTPTERTERAFQPRGEARVVGPLAARMLLVAGQSRSRPTLAEAASRAGVGRRSSSLILWLWFPAPSAFHPATMDSR